jgi:hypothetical protein
MNEKRMILLESLIDALEAAPATQRAALADALEDYEKTYPRNRQGRAPLLRGLMAALGDAMLRPPPEPEPERTARSHWFLGLEQTVAGLLEALEAAGGHAAIAGDAYQDGLKMLKDIEENVTVEYVYRQDEPEDIVDRLRAVAAGREGGDLSDDHEALLREGADEIMRARTAACHHCEVPEFHEGHEMEPCSYFPGPGRCEHQDPKLTCLKACPYDA